MKKYVNPSLDIQIATLNHDDMLMVSFVDGGHDIYDYDDAVGGNQ